MDIVFATLKQQNFAFTCKFSYPNKTQINKFSAKFTSFTRNGIFAFYLNLDYPTKTAHEI